MNSNRSGRSSGQRVRSLSAALILTFLSLALGAMPAAGQTGREPELAFTPSTNGVYDYGTVSLTASQTFTLTNSGASASGALSVGLTGSATFTKTADTCTGTSLGPTKTCTVTVAFSPPTAGSDTATLTATGRKTGVTTSLVLTGTGIRRIYWSNGNGISRADVDGQNVSQFITTAAIPGGLAVDSHHIYWSHFSGTIGRADLDGQNVNENFITGANDPRGVVADSQHIYWSNLVPDTIGRADLNGQNANNNFITGLETGPRGLAVDSGHIYWTAWAISKIGRADLGGGNVNQNFIISNGQSNGVAVDSGHVYWTIISFPNIGAIGRADLDGGNVNNSFITDEHNPVGIAVDPN
jgi:virginiamycin B lyase